jgi:hypothetical protein
VLDELCAHAGVNVRLDSQVIDAERITAVRVADHAGIHKMTASVFVDATGKPTSPTTVAPRCATATGESPICNLMMEAVQG